MILGQSGNFSILTERNLCLYLLEICTKMHRLAAIFSIIIFTYSAHCQERTPTQPVGGKAQLRHFTEQELIYPEECLQAGIEGVVTIAYRISEKGQVEHVRFHEKSDPLFNLEAMRIFRMIEWEPARVAGVPAGDSGFLDIDFNIRRYNRLSKQRGYTSHYYPFEPIDTSGVIHDYKNLETAPFPVFRNDKINLAAFIAANLVYPEAAIRQSLSGTVKVGFIVEPHGRPSNISILNSLGAGCNEEAIRLVRMIKWMPGTIGHKAVRTRMSISINFMLDQSPDGIYRPNIKSSYGG